MYCDPYGIENGKLGIKRRDVFVVRTAPMDEQGYFNFGISNCCTFEQAVGAKTVIVRKIPRCL